MDTRLLTPADLPPPLAKRTGFPWTEGTPARTDLPENAPRITVVTPSYNQGEYLEETIRSVLLQGYPNLEYLVVDGGSTDESRNIIARYAPFLAWHVSEKDSGQANAINKGLARGTGEVMGWLNSDDVLLPGALWHIADTFAARPEADFVTGMRHTIDEHSAWTSNWLRDRPSAHYLRHYCVLAQETTYWRRRAWDALGPLDETFQFAMDYEYWLRAVSRDMQLAFIPHYIGAFREYATSKSFSWLDVYYRDLHRLYQRYEMGASEAEILARLGGRWRRRYAWFLRASHHRWTHDPRRVLLAWRLLDLPFVSDTAFASVRVGELYQDARTFRRLPPLGAAVHTGRTIVREVIRVLGGECVQPPGPGDVRHLKSLALAPEIVTTDAADVPVLGQGWYGVEIDKGAFTVCSIGESEILLLNPRARRYQIEIEVRPIQMRPDDALLVSVDGNMAPIELPVPDPMTPLAFSLDVAERKGPAIVRLRWKHGSVEREYMNLRPQAFRIARFALLPQANDASSP
jgi:glycosyltransferase involved in cell wall biosynthesis